MCEERCQAGGTLDKPGEAGRMVYSIMMTVNNETLSPNLLCPRLLRLRLEAAYP